MKRILFLSLLIFCLATFFSGFNGTTYYIGADVTDDYASWTAMQVAVQEVAGDTVSFRKGETFREQVTVPNSGTSENVITYTAHGEGANPIINGADLITGWTTVPTNLIDPDASTNESGTYGWIVYQHNTIENDNKTLKITYIDNPEGAIWQFKDSKDLWRDLETGHTYNFSIDAKVNEGSSVTMKIYDNVSVVTVATITNTEFEAKTHQFTAGANPLDCWVLFNGMGDGEICWVDNGYLEEDGRSSDIWQATLATEPGMVFFDGTCGNIQGALVDVDSEFDWFWEANVLYVYYEEDPDGAVDIEASVRDFCIDTNSQDYIVIERLKLKHGISANVLLDGANQTDLNYCISVDGVDGVEMDTAASKVQNCVIYGCTNGIDVDAAGCIKNTIIRSCTDDLEETGANIQKTTNNIEDDSDADPLMTDPTNGDFTLQFGSPCINRGAHVGLFVDFLGLPVPIGHCPDIGAYEHKNGGRIF